jgi:hypothetical protein
MAQILKPMAHRVDIIEYERGWGSKVDDVVYFDNKAEAVKYCEDFNARNTETAVPDWYMVAEYRGLV